MIKQLFQYLWQQKLWWMIPLLLVFLVFGIFITISTIVPIGPFIYMLF